MLVRDVMRRGPICPPDATVDEAARLMIHHRCRAVAIIDLADAADDVAIGDDAERTLGGVRDVLNWRGFEGGIGADVTFYGVPTTLQPMYSSHPVSFHVFFRLRPPAGAMGRMWNRRMSQPMAGHHVAGM